jgi:Co/Zn/Cd efflux system component
MDGCCEIRPVQARQRRVLRVVLWINLGMFLAELAAGIVAHSTALLADSVDMLGDAIVYGFSLYVVARAPLWQHRAALLKGLIMAGFGIGIAAEVASKLARGLTPEAGIMWAVALAALVANGGVLLAALGVAWSGRAWPDILVGLAIAALFATSAAGVIREALATQPSA